VLRVLVVQPDPGTSLDRFTAPLTGAGLRLEVVRPYVQGELPDRLDTEALVVLGGPMGTSDDENHPWLARIRDLLRQAVRDTVPTLGICLGAQLLADACGGRVVRGDAGAEAGVIRIRLRPEAQADALFSGLPSTFAAAALHLDVVDVLPEGAVWLGRSQLYPHQAFRIGKAAWGVQFHPEMSSAGFRSWVDRYQAHDPETARRAREGLPQFGPHEPLLAVTADIISAGFAAVIADLIRGQRSGDPCAMAARR
jgi:GMP synthase (glutamine-hydrolysing)